MSGENQQIITAFEDLGMSPEEIAEDRGFELVFVKSILMQCSSLYRKASKQDSALEFTEREAEEMKGIILNLARYSDDDPHLQFKAASFILNDKKGRLDGGRQLSDRQAPVIQFNIQMQKALAAKERTQQKCIDIQMEKQILETCGK